MVRGSSLAVCVATHEDVRAWLGPAWQMQWENPLCPQGAQGGQEG